jgi:predicted dehydrogenase
MNIRIALIGMGGYGAGYAQELFKASADHSAQLIAGIDPAPERCRFLPDFYRAGIPIFPNLQDFFAQHHADLVVLSSPIHMHAPQTCLALAHGANVLCEKPICAVIQDARQMAEAERQSGKFVAIGYQFSFTTAIHELKRDILRGDFGKPKRLKTRILWPRMASYYHRNSWAGRIKSDSGEWVLDSPANNAMAHYLHNALYILGKTPATSARPISVQAELYRANPIENYDAVALRVVTEGNVEVLFYAAHTIPEESHPVFCYEFEAATIEYAAYSESNLIARFHNGSVRTYGDPTAAGAEWRKLWNCVDAIRSGEPVVCGIEAASAHTRCINGAQESTDITTIPPEGVRQEPRGEEDTLTWVVGLQETLLQSFTQGCLPAELGTFPWARIGKIVDLTQYDHFPNLSQS